jgi:transcriptional regulator of arginine metabolism
MIPLNSNKSLTRYAHLVSYMRIFIQPFFMSNSHEIQLDRREAIRQLLLHGPAANQQSLVAALISRGYVATQSSVSRDLREIGAIKTASGYALPQNSASGDDELLQVTELLRDLQSAGPNLLVIKTATGAAQRVALALDRCGWPEIVGNVGGDDTVFTATNGANAQRNLIARIGRATSRHW